LYSNVFLCVDGRGVHRDGLLFSSGIGDHVELHRRRYTARPLRQAIAHLAIDDLVLLRRGLHPAPSRDPALRCQSVAEEQSRSSSYQPAGEIACRSRCISPYTPQSPSIKRMEWAHSGFPSSLRSYSNVVSIYTIDLSLRERERPHGDATLCRGD